MPRSCMFKDTDARILKKEILVSQVQKLGLVAPISLVSTTVVLLFNFFFFQFECNKFSVLIHGNLLRSAIIFYFLRIKLDVRAFVIVLIHTCPMVSMYEV